MGKMHLFHFLPSSYPFEEFSVFLSQLDNTISFDIPDSTAYIFTSMLQQFPLLLFFIPLNPAVLLPPTEPYFSWAMLMDQITIKTPNPKCRLYWCSIEFIDWRYSQPCWYFRPFLWTSAPLTFSLVHQPPPPSLCPWVNKYRGMYSCTVCNMGGGIGWCGDHIQKLYTV